MKVVSALSRVPSTHELAFEQIFSWKIPHFNSLFPINQSDSGELTKVRPFTAATLFKLSATWTFTSHEKLLRCFSASSEKSAGKRKKFIWNSWRHMFMETNGSNWLVLGVIHRYCLKIYFVVVRTKGPARIFYLNPAWKWANTINPRGLCP